MGDPIEAEERLRIGNVIDAWWAEFVRKAPDLDALFARRTDWDLPEWMDRHLQAIESSLMWEFGPGVNGGHRLVITPEMRRYLRPLLDEILRRAPAVPGWEFYPYRLAESLDMTLRTVEARTGGDLSGSLFTAAARAGNHIDLTFYLPSFSDEEAGRRHAFVATETLLGEEVLDKWIGAISVERLRKAVVGEPLGVLRERVQALIQRIHAALPATPCFEVSQSAEWTLFKLKPAERENDYPAQSDMFVGKAMSVDRWRAAHAGGGFASVRFSRHRETFCYVKLDGREGLDEERFEDKAEIEDALDATLIPQRLGSHVGGGTGRWYSYIDLALTDVDRGCEAVRSVLRSGNVPKRSWILFFDDEWAHEWIGVYDDSPPPPMEPDDD